MEGEGTILVGRGRYIMFGTQFFPIKGFKVNGVWGWWFKCVFPQFLFPPPIFQLCSWILNGNLEIPDEAFFVSLWDVSFSPPLFVSFLFSRGISWDLLQCFPLLFFKKNPQVYSFQNSLGIFVLAIFSCCILCCFVGIFSDGSKVFFRICNGSTGILRFAGSNFSGFLLLLSIAVETLPSDFVFYYLKFLSFIRLYLTEKTRDFCYLCKTFVIAHLSPIC